MSRARHGGAWWWVAALCLWPAFVAAQPAERGVAGAGALSAADARAWLTRIHAAARVGNYQGTLVYSTGGMLSSSRVWHYWLGDQTYEMLETLDGRQQRIARHNDTVHTLWPQKKLAVLERRETLAAWSTTPQAIDPQALGQYELRREGSARIAGRDASVLLLEPRDALRYGQRLWADLATGLMLRADVIAAPVGGHRTVLESTAFSVVEIGVKPEPERVLQLMRQPEGYQVLRPQQRRTTPDAEGWELTQPVAGFTLAGSLRRGMATEADSEPVLQAVFSDGLTHVSVFMEPYQPQHHRSEVQAQQGATATLMMRRGEHWITVVGNIPPATLKLFAAAFERRRP